MKVAKVEVILVDIPLTKGFEISRGAFTGERIIVKVHIDEGIAGFGEAAPSTAYSEETPDTVRTIIEKHLAPAIIGVSPFNIESIIEKMDREVFGHPFAKSAIDIAIHDAIAKMIERPLCDLIGGWYRDKIQLAWGAGMPEPTKAAEESMTKIKEGYKIIKLKIGRDLEKDTERVAAVREAIDDKAEIIVDANQAYTPAFAIKVLKRMERYDLRLIEQPVPRWDLNGMARVAKALDTPIMADESVFSPLDALNVIEKIAADLIAIKISKAGGLYNAKKIAAIAEAGGIPCSLGTMLEAGIGTAASAHFGAATKIIQYCTLVGPLYMSDDLIREPLSIGKGWVQVPKGAGLGVEIDEEAINKLRVT